MKTKDNKESKISRCIKAPIRALSRARDFYVRSMNNLGGEASFGGGCPSAQATTLPKSFSINNASLSTRRDEDFRELLRVASTRSLSNKIESEFLRRQQSTRGGGGALKVVARSQSVGIGRIDEDHTCDFGDEDIKFQDDS